MSKESTELIWHTLRNMSVYAHRYRDNYQDVALELANTIPWQKWPKGKIGELMYDSVLCLAYCSQRTVDDWIQKHPECPYDLAADPWYWIASWASHNPLDYYVSS